MILHNRNLDIHLTGKRSDTGRTGKLLHVRLLRGNLQYATDPAAIFHGDARFEQLHIIHRIRVERGEQAEQVRRVIYRSAIEQNQVLVGSTTSHIISAGSLAHGGHTR